MFYNNLTRLLLSVVLFLLINTRSSAQVDSSILSIISKHVNIDTLNYSDRDGMRQGWWYSTPEPERIPWLKVDYDYTIMLTYYKNNLAYKHKEVGSDGNLYFDSYANVTCDTVSKYSYYEGHYTRIEMFHIFDSLCCYLCIDESNWYKYLLFSKKYNEAGLIDVEILYKLTPEQSNNGEFDKLVIYHKYRRSKKQKHRIIEYYKESELIKKELLRH